jgi:triosephosphate isomerase
MRTPLVAGNWKMHCTIDEAVALVSSIRQELGSVASVEVAVCPPFTAVKAVADLLADSEIQIGAQDVFFEDSGAYTGEVSPLMLAGMCRYCIVGHSERRGIFGESDDTVAKKFAALRAHGILPVLCIGETLEENESGQTERVLERQVRAVFWKDAPTSDTVIAYEPVWAIGTGRAAEPEGVNDTIRTVRRLLAMLSDEATADSVRILYGGSVNPDNAGDYVGRGDIDGYLVGGASLKAQDFCEIVFRTAARY